MIINRNKMAPVIVIDGMDGCGKTTQVELLKGRYKNMNFMKFPNYNSNTGKFITYYLNGEFNNMLNDLNLKDKINTISILYTMDRVLWFNTEYNKYKPLLCDRYTTSNIIHMSTLIINDGGTLEDVYNYIDELEELEYKKFNIPEPDLVIYLDMTTNQLKENLNNTERVLDIHENESIFKNIEFIKEKIFDYCGWNIVNCMDKNNKLKSIETIHNEIINIIENFYPFELTNM